VTVVGASLHGFFNSGLWTAISRLAILFTFVLYASVVVWVYKDARRRIDDSVLVWTAVALPIVVPFLGAFVYMLFRPPEYLEDVRERELEIKAMERRLGGRDLHCPVCRAEVDSTFLICPVCTTRLRQACTGCSAPLEALWQVCPFCETPIESDGTTVPIEQPRRRRRERPSA
jgi:predicted membrane channel-forming protein YqfA (hemolysin III family)